MLVRIGETDGYLERVLNRDLPVTPKLQIAVLLLLEQNREKGRVGLSLDQSHMG